MTNALYLNDAYLKEFSATVVKVDGDLVYLDKTAFYPRGGGQPEDTGTLEVDGKVYEVVNVKKTEDGIAHEVQGLKKGDTVVGKINWERRYKLMRYHTAIHVLCSIIHGRTNAQITGNNISEEKAHIDFGLEDFDREKLGDYLKEANEKIAEEAEITLSSMPREEALKDPALVKLANVLPPNIAELRIVEIKDIDKQADGGTHVNNTKEVGTLELVKLDNRGKGKKRIYFTLKP